ncbi:hypothetical protein HYT53_03725 [Candidatus Woesearchaeota archaeon]|nr:hypothetical protein [Candidatus Woesearchaeota archaeon]
MAEALLVFTTIIIILSLVLATSIVYENNITANVAKETAISENGFGLKTIEVRNVNELSHLNEGWYQIINGYVYYLDSFNSYVSLYIKVRNPEEQNGLLIVEADGTARLDKTFTGLPESEVADEGEFVEEEITIISKLARITGFQILSDKKSESLQRATKNQAYYFRSEVRDPFLYDKAIFIWDNNAKEWKVTFYGLFGKKEYPAKDVHKLSFVNPELEDVAQQLTEIGAPPENEEAQEAYQEYLQGIKKSSSFPGISTISETQQQGTIKTVQYRREFEGRGYIDWVDIDGDGKFDPKVDDWYGIIDGINVDKGVYLSYLGKNTDYQQNEDFGASISQISATQEPEKLNTEIGKSNSLNYRKLGIVDIREAPETLTFTDKDGEVHTFRLYNPPPEDFYGTLSGLRGYYYDEAYGFYETGVPKGIFVIPLEGEVFRSQSKEFLVKNVQGDPRGSYSYDVEIKSVVESQVIENPLGKIFDVSTQGKTQEQYDTELLEIAQKNEYIQIGSEEYYLDGDSIENLKLMRVRTLGGCDLCYPDETVSPDEYNEIHSEALRLIQEAQAPADASKPDSQEKPKYQRIQDFADNPDTTLGEYNVREDGTIVNNNNQVVGALEGGELEKYKGKKIEVRLTDGLSRATVNIIEEKSTTIPETPATETQLQATIGPAIKKGGEYYILSGNRELKASPVIDEESGNIVGFNYKDADNKYYITTESEVYRVEPNGQLVLLEKYASTALVEQRSAPSPAPRQIQQPQPLAKQTYINQEDDQKARDVNPQTLEKYPVGKCPPTISCVRVEYGRVLVQGEEDVRSTTKEIKEGAPPDILSVSAPARTVSPAVKEKILVLGRDNKQYELEIFNPVEGKQKIVYGGVEITTDASLLKGVDFKKGFSYNAQTGAITVTAPGGDQRVIVKDGATEIATDRKYGKDKSLIKETRTEIFEDRRTKTTITDNPLNPEKFQKIETTTLADGSRIEVKYEPKQAQLTDKAEVKVTVDGKTTQLSGKSFSELQSTNPNLVTDENRRNQILTEAVKAGVDLTKTQQGVIGDKSGLHLNFEGENILTMQKDLVKREVTKDGIEKVYEGSVKLEDGVPTLGEGATSRTFNSKGELQEVKFVKDGQKYEFDYSDKDRIKIDTPRGYMEIDKTFGFDPTDTNYGKIKVFTAICPVDECIFEGSGLLSGPTLYYLDSEGKKKFVDADSEILALMQTAADNQMVHGKKGKEGFTLKQLNSQRFFAEVERIFTEFRGLGYYATLFFDEDSLMQWRDKIDRAFATLYLGTEYWSSAICSQYIDGEDEGVAFAETPQGLAQIGAHIEARRTEAIETGTGQEFIYMITFNIRNGDYDKDPRAPEEMNVNVLLKGERRVNVFKSDVEIKRGSTFGRMGRNAIVQESAFLYTQVCIVFDEIPLRWKLEDKELCNTIVESSGEPTPISGTTATATTSTGTGGSSDINDF